MNHQIIGQLRLFFGLQNASCCLVVVAFSLFLLVAHTCIIIIIIYCKCRGVIFFHSLLFRYVLPHSNCFHILILALFSLFQIFKWIWWRKQKIFLWTGTRCAQTDMNVDRKKLPGWTLLSHSDVLQEIWKTFSAVVHSKIVFFSLSFHMRGLVPVKLYLFLSFLIKRYYAWW